MLRALIVNNRSPKFALDCPTCGTNLDAGYCRDLTTRILYCSYRCFDAEEKEVAIEARAS